MVVGADFQLRSFNNEEALPMCKGSVFADSTRDPEEHEPLRLSTGAHGIGTFHQPGVSPTDCATCLVTGDEVVLSPIPGELMEAYGLDSAEPAIMIEMPGSESEVIHDEFFLPNHPGLGTIPTVVFADVGIQVMMIKLAEGEISPADVIGREPTPTVADDESRDVVFARHQEALAAAA